MEMFHPFKAVTHALDGDALHALIRANAPLTSGQVHRMRGRGSRAGIVKVLDRLVRQGTVLREREGRIFYYEFNQGHLFANALRTIADGRTDWYQRMRYAIEGWDAEPLYVGVVEAAHTPEHAAEDPIEMLVLLPTAADVEHCACDVEQLRRESQELTGNRTEFHVMAADALSRDDRIEVMHWCFGNTPVYGNEQAIWNLRRFNSHLGDPAARIDAATAS